MSSGVFDNSAVYVIQSNVDLLLYVESPTKYSNAFNKLNLSIIIVSIRVNKTWRKNYLEQLIIASANDGDLW